MKISLINAGKRYNRDWIFRNVHYEFQAGSSYAITGPNGSGKSTLLQVVGGAIMTSEGEVKYEVRPPLSGRRGDGGEAEVSADFAFQHLSIAAPYLEVIE